MTQPQSPGPDPKALRELLAKATPGPWTADGQGSAFGFYGADDDRIMSASDHWSTNTPSDEDAALIVAAVNALPGLLDRLEAADRALFEGRCCVGAHEGFRQARTLIHDKEWGWLALCAQCSAGMIVETGERVDRLEVSP